MQCLSGVCYDPCTSKRVCGESALCFVEKHEIICTCIPGYTGNPKTECSLSNIHNHTAPNDTQSNQKPKDYKNISIESEETTQHSMTNTPVSKMEKYILFLQLLKLRLQQVLVKNLNRLQKLIREQLSAILNREQS